jgi:hypothetical protein
MERVEEKDLKYWRANAEEDYMTTPISVLRYISELELTQPKAIDVDALLEKWKEANPKLQLFGSNPDSILNSFADFIKQQPNSIDIHSFAYKFYQWLKETEKTKVVTTNDIAQFVIDWQGENPVTR